MIPVLYFEELGPENSNQEGGRFKPASNDDNQFLRVLFVLHSFPMNCPSGQHCQAGHDVYYRVTARDAQFESVPSDQVKTHVLGGAPDKVTTNPKVDIIPKEYKLGQNYPNPFNPLTTIEYQLPKSGLVQLKVYDLLGSEVAVLVNEVQSEGSYTINFDASNLPSGVYIYSFRVNDFMQNNKMTLLK